MTRGAFRKRATRCTLLWFEQDQGITAETWFEKMLSIPLESTAVVT